MKIIVLRCQCLAPKVCYKLVIYLYENLISYTPVRLEQQEYK